MHTPGLPVSRPYVAAMKAAPCSWRVRTSLIDDLRRLSTTSRFSSPGTPKIRSTPSFSSAATSKSEPLVIIPLSTRLSSDSRMQRNFRGEHVSLVCAHRPSIVEGLVDSRLGVLAAEDQHQDLDSKQAAR